MAYILWLLLGVSPAAPSSNPTAQESPMSTPTDRVLAFITAFEAAHAEGAKGFDTGAGFDAWRALVAELDRAHFDRGAGMELSQSFSGNPTHTVDERVHSVEQDGDHAVVVTQGSMSTLTVWFEYELVRRDDTWRIARIAQHFDPPDAPYVPEDHRAALLSPIQRPLRDPEPGVEVNSHRLFEHGRETKHGQSTVEVRDVGTLTTTGVLAVGDFGYDHDLMQPLAMRVPAGSYPVQTAVAFGRNAALRVRLHDAPAVAWHPADVPAGGHIVGVDAGNVTIADAQGLVALTSSTKEKLYERWAYSTDHPSVHRLDMATEGDGVICASGFGDGAYPVYWGVDDTGRPVELLVDFLVLAEWLSDTVDLPITDGQAARDGLTIALSATDTLTELHVDATDRRPTEVLLLDDAGQELASTARARTTRVAGTRSTHHFDDPSIATRATTVRVILPAGYRN